MKAGSAEVVAPMRWGGALALGVFVGSAVASAVVVTSAVEGDWEIRVFGVGGVLLIVSALWMHRLVRLFDLSRPTIPAFFWFTYVAMIFVPGSLLALNRPDESGRAFLTGIQSVLLAVPLGIAIALAFAGVRGSDIKRHLDREIGGSDSPALQGVFVVLLLACLSGTAFYLATAGRIGLVEIVRHRGDVPALIGVRVETARGFGVATRYLFGAVEQVIGPFLVVSSLALFLRTRSRFWTSFAAVSVPACILHNALSTQKGNVALIFAMMALYYWMYRRGRLGVWILGAFALVFAYPFFVAFMIRGEHLGAWRLILGIKERLLFVPAYVLFPYFDVFPSSVPFLGGASSRGIAFLLGREFVNVPRLIYEGYLFPGTEGNSNAAFIGNAYADFGMPGVLLAGVLAGCIMGGLQAWLTRQHRTELSVALAAFLMIAIWKLNSTALPMVLASHGLAPGVILYLVCRSAATHADRSRAGERGAWAT